MAELRYTYLLDVKDLASRQVAQANARITRSVEQTNVAMRQQGTVAESAASRVRSAGARQAAEWKQVERAARTAERQVAQAATSASAAVSKATERQVRAQRAAGQSYQQIARQQKAAGVSARETAAAIEQASARESRAMRGTAATAQKSGAQAVGGLRGKLSEFKGFAGGLAATFAAFKGFEFLRDSVEETEKLGLATRRLTGLTDMDARTASGWVVIGKERGIALNQLGRAFVTLERNQVKATQGTKTSADAFKQLGISQQTLRTAKPDVLIGRIADAFKRLGPGPVRTTIAQQLFGRGAQSLVNVLGSGSKGLRQLQNDLRRSGATMDEQGVKKALALAKAQRALNAQFLGLKLTVGQAVIPFLTRGAQALSRFIAQMRAGTGPGGQVRKVLEQIGAGAAQLAKALGPVAKALGPAFVVAARIAGTAIGGMTQIIRSLVGIVRGMVGVVTNLLKGNFAGAWRGVKRIISSALSGLGGLVKTLMAPVYTAVSAVVGRALKALGGLGSGIVGVLRGAIGGVAKAAGAVAGAVLGAFRTLSRLIAGVWNGIVGTIRGAVGTIKDAVGGITSLPGKVLGAINPFGGRSGGIAGQGGFRRYQSGGLVPAMLSPGEMVVHGNAGMIVPGQPTPADNVPMLLPAGAAVLTGDGQRRMMAGASLSQAVASQAPHFATGGWVRTGATVFSDNPPGAFGSLRGGYAELGTATRGGGATGSGYLARALGRRGELPAHYPLEVKIHGRSKVLRKQDRGYGQGTPAYSIDIWRDSWPFFGIDSSFKGPVLVRPADGSSAGAGAGASRASGRIISGLEQAMSRHVGRSAQRAGLVDDAYGLGFEQGTAGLTLDRLRYRTDSAYRTIADAYRLPAAKTVNVPGAKSVGGRGGTPVGGGRRAWRGVGPQGVHSAVRAIASAIMGAFPALQATSTTGGTHASGSYHYRGRAVDIGGPQGVMDRAAAWTRNRFTRRLAEGIHRPGLSVKDGRSVPPGFWGASTWAGHGNHLHIAARRGGWIGYRTGTGSVQPRDPLGRYVPGAPMQVGPVIRQETTGTGIASFGKRLQDALARALTWQAGTFERLNATIQRAAESKLGALRNRLQAAVRRGGAEAIVKRLQGALDLVDKELGRRAGLLERRITQRAAASDRRTARGDIALRLAGTDPESAAGLTARLHTAADAGKDLWRSRRDMERQLRLAGRARNLAEIARLKDALADNMTAILDSRASQRELARARDDANRSARLAFVAGLTDIQTRRVGLASSGLQTLELRQRLAGTYDTGGQERADYIRQSVIPALEAEREGIRLQGIEAMRQNNAELAAQFRQAWEDKGNEILQAMLDVKDATETTADNTDTLKSLGGTLGFEFQGARLTDDLYASGVGA